MTCEDLSDNIRVTIGTIVFFTGLLALGIITATLVYYISWLTSEPVECIDGQAYEITIQGNVKYLDEVVGTKCEQLQ